MKLETEDVVQLGRVLNKSKKQLKKTSSIILLDLFIGIARLIVMYLLFRAFYFLSSIVIVFDMVNKLHWIASLTFLCHLGPMILFFK